MTSPAQETYTAFFYGTLMAPSVLTRVIGPRNPTSQPFSTNARPNPPTFRPAVLPRHRRHRVQNADYPAVIPCKSSTVRGTLVSNLTSTDLKRLDIFEGYEYDRRPVRVRLLPDTIEEGGGVAEPLAYGGIAPVLSDDKGEKDEEGFEWADTQTYIWVAGEAQLGREEWDFEHFRRERLHLWAGEVVADEGMREVDWRYGDDGTRGRGVRSGEFEKAVGEQEIINAV